MQDAKMSPKIAIWAPSHNFVGLYLRNWGTYRQSENNLLSSGMSSTCPHNMMNFGLLMTEIRPVVWGTPGKFNELVTDLLRGSRACRACRYLVTRKLRGNGPSGIWPLLHGI